MAMHVGSQDKFHPFIWNWSELFKTNQIKKIMIPQGKCSENQKKIYIINQVTHDTQKHRT